jgi:tetratricopeptide (TPR) repeat protein
MRKQATRLLIAVFLVTAAGVGIHLHRTTYTVDSPSSVPELFQVGPSEVSIAWYTPTPGTGILWYAPPGAAYHSITEASGPTQWHEIRMTALKPGTQYSYHLGSEEQVYRFQTQLPVNSPFSFLLASAHVDLTNLVTTELPEFVWLVNPGQPRDKISPYLPMFDPNGPVSAYLDQMNGDPVTTSHTLDWAGLRLIVLKDPQDLDPLLDTQSTHTQGLIWLCDFPLSQDHPVHAQIDVHNQQYPNHPVAFVWQVGERLSHTQRHDLYYVTLPRPVAARVDVTAESTSMVLLNTTPALEITLRAAPLQQRRTCEQCRRLADQGAYEASVEAYQAFIRNNPEHFQIDDAYYAVAELLDNRLFKLAEAVTWYQRLLERYPDSALAPAASIRLSMLQTYGDFDYRPLAAFERIRQHQYIRARDNPSKQTALLQELITLTETYPQSKTVPLMLYWTANQYRPLNTDQAIALYRQVLSAFPQSEQARSAWFEIGETLYEAQQYDAAIEIYRQAIERVPVQKETFLKQIFRAQRNIRRIHLAHGSWCLTGVLLLLGMRAWPQVLTTCLVRIMGLFLVNAFLLGIFAWLIQEQFGSGREMLGLVLGLAAMNTWAYGTGASLGMRFRDKPIIRAFLSATIHLVFFCAASYLLLYYNNEHYLIVFGL